MLRRLDPYLGLFILALLFARLNLFSAHSANHPVHNLNTGLDYSTIQEAIDSPATLDGHMIFVEAGYYYGKVELNKHGLTLMGEGKSKTVIDGNGADIVVSLKANNTKIMGFTLKNGRAFGVLMSPWTEGHIICNNTIVNNHYGLSGHYACANVSVLDNIVAYNNVTGLLMDFSFSLVQGNLISDNGRNKFQQYGSGIQVAVGYLPNNGIYSYCVNNTVSANTIKNHQVGVWVTDYSEHNLFIHNNFVNNRNQFLHSAAQWNNTLIENYWSNYNETDANNDGIGEAPFIVSDLVYDESPLMGMFFSFIVSTDAGVEIVSNSTLESFQYFESNATMKLYVSNSSEFQVYGFCRAVIPHVLVSEPFNVAINDATPVYWNYELYDNGSHRWIYFEYPHSTLEIIIIPEFSSFGVLLSATVTILLFVLIKNELEQEEAVRK